MMARRLRLKFWLRCMQALERRGLEETPLYYWLTRRAMGCNPWRSMKGLL